MRHMHSKQNATIFRRQVSILIWALCSVYLNLVFHFISSHSVFGLSFYLLCFYGVSLAQNSVFFHTLWSNHFVRHPICGAAQCSVCRRQIDRDASNLKWLFAQSAIIVSFEMIILCLCVNTQTNVPVPERQRHWELQSIYLHARLCGVLSKYVVCCIYWIWHQFVCLTNWSAVK